MNKRIFLAATGKNLSRAEFIEDEWHLDRSLQGTQINTLITDPLHPQKVYAGTQRNGILVSFDAGKSWRNLGLKDKTVKSIAIHPQNPDIIFAGCKPVSLYASKNAGESWEEYEGLRRARRWWWFSPAEPPEWSAYVIALTISPTNPDVIMAGIELGGVLRSEDGGQTWSKHRRGAERDCHSLKFHLTNGKWVYQGGGGGPALSQDGGVSWRKAKNGLGTKYGWMVASDPKQPEVWYFSASNLPKLWKGEFEPPAHKDGQANAHIYRSVGGASWEQLSGGLPEPLDYMAYSLVTDANAPGHLYAGLSNGDVWQTQNYGDTWRQLPFNLGGIHHSMIMI
jgi:photosystem II stability/assembly factor-like uncharacterized protein